MGAKLTAAKMIDMCLYSGCDFNKDYENARVLVFDEKNNLIVSEMAKDLLHKTYKMLKDYVLIQWTTDWKHNEKEDINTLILFVKKA